MRRVESGEWRVESGEWRVESGEWRVESGEWRVASGEWRVASGEWRVASGEWGVGSGVEWSGVCTPHSHSHSPFAYFRVSGIRCGPCSMTAPVTFPWPSS